MNRVIALLGLVVVRTATARFLRGLAEHSPANVTTANYTRCVFQEVRRSSKGLACHPENEKKRNLYEKVRSMDKAFALCDADPKCDAVQRTPHRKGNNNGVEWEDEETEEEEEAEREEWEEAERRSLQYGYAPHEGYNEKNKKGSFSLCALGKDACGRVKLHKVPSRGYRVFTCLPYDEAPAMRSEGLFALCVIMIFACPFLIIIVAAVVAAAAAGCPDGPDPDGPDPEVSPVFTFLFCPLVVFWFLTFAFLSTYYGPAYNHSTDGACAPNPWGTHRTTIVKYGIIATVLLVCVPALPAAIQTCAQALAAAISCCTGMAGCATTRPRERRMDLWQACSCSATCSPWR